MDFLPIRVDLHELMDTYAIQFVFGGIILIISFLFITSRYYSWRQRSEKKSPRSGISRQ